MKTAKRQAKWSLSILLLILMLSLAYTSYGADTLKPHPISPQTWRFFPAPSGSTSITMQASRCYDSNEPCSPPVWYYYQCTTTGHTDINSGWIQDSNATYDANTIWTATGLDPNTTYGFKYRARDSADPCNMTNWSGAKSAKTDKATTPAVLRLDLNAETDSNAINNRPGFTPFTIADSGKTIGGVSVDLAANISEKRNPDPCGQWFSMLGDANQEYYQRAGETLYQDMIFGISPNGIKVTLWGLGVNQDCNLTLFAYDDKSTSEGNRVAHWFSNGTPIFDTNFIGGQSTSLRNENDYPNDIYKWAYSKRVTADAFGRIVLTSTRGSGSPETQPFSFINALVVEPNALTPFVPTKYAYHPVPVDDTNNVPADVTLEWKQGGYAEKHDVYLGTNLAKVTDANRSNPLGVLVSENQSTTTYTPPEFLDFSTTYYWRIDEVNSAPDYTIFKGEVWSFTTSVPVLIASNPVPPDDAEGVFADVILSWERGEFADKHDVYFGTNLANVTDASRSNPLGVLVSEDQSATTYDPPESLDVDTTYYWRIDEVNAAPYYTIFKGDLWSFRVGDWRYFGQTPPGASPQVFAPGFISTVGRYEHGLCSTQDAGEYFFTVRASDWSSYYIMTTRYENGQWATPAMASFSNTFSMAPSLADNDQSMYFSMNADIYKAVRTPTGWSSPVYQAAPVSSSQDDWSVCISNLGNLWTCSWRPGGDGGCDIWRLQGSGGSFINPTNISIMNTAANDCGPVVGPNEDYVIFTSNYPGGFGGVDLYVSFSDGQGNWTSPVNMGPTVNTAYNETAPSLSPDYKYLFFARNSASDEDIYWVDASTLFLECDFQRNGKVDFEDLAVLASEWLDCGLEPSEACSQNGREIIWTQKADLPIPLGQCSAETVNGKIYVMGGRSPAFPEYYGTVNYEFSPDSNTWASKKNMPSGKTNFAIATVNNKIYAIGGDPFSDIVEAYDPATDSWGIVTNMPTPRQHISCGVVNNKIYVVGGLTSWSTFTSKNEVYDPATNTWQTLAPMPTPRHGARIASCNGKIYVFGGMGDSNSIWTPRDTVEAYDPVTNSWETKEKMPTPRTGFGVSVQNEDVLVTGGYAGDDLITSSIFFDTINNAWYPTTDLPYETDSFAYVTIGNEFYLFGGEDPNNTQYSYAYEGVIAPEPVCIQPPSTDLNGDCKVDFQDFAAFAQYWLETSY